MIDFSKGFDSSSHDYIYKTLSYFNFGEYFIKIVRTMLTGRTCTVMIDGFEMKPFKIEREVPQGDTASTCPGNPSTQDNAGWQRDKDQTHAPKS